MGNQAVYIKNKESSMGFCGAFQRREDVYIQNNKWKTWVLKHKISISCTSGMEKKTTKQ